MKTITQDEINNYILGSLQMSLNNRKHLEAMVILHYDIPDERASEMVGKALVRALEYYRHFETKQQNEIRSTQHMIATLENWTPELK